MTEMQPVAQSVNWWVVGGSSAVISALVNGAFKLWGDHIARRDERVKRAEQRAPAQLEAVLMLEAFAKQAAGYVDRCQGWIGELYGEQHGEPTGEEPVWTPLTLDTSGIEDWSALPIRIVSRIRELPLALVESAAWIRASFDEGWLDATDAYEMDSQRGIFYGLIAADLANEIRGAIHVPPSDLATDCFERLQREFDILKRRYVKARGDVDRMIPDLKARLQREVPHLAAEGPALSQSAR